MSPAETTTCWRSASRDGARAAKSPGRACLHWKGPCLACSPLSPSSCRQTSGGPAWPWAQQGASWTAGRLSCVFVLVLSGLEGSWLLSRLPSLRCLAPSTLAPAHGPACPWPLTRAAWPVACPFFLRGRVSLRATGSRACSLAQCLSGRICKSPEGETAVFYPSSPSCAFLEEPLSGQVGGAEGGVGREQTPSVPWDVRLGGPGASVSWSHLKVLEDGEAGPETHALARESRRSACFWSPSSPPSLIRYRMHLELDTYLF